MKNFIPRWAIPLNIFQLLGTTCCAAMAREYSQKNFSKHYLCYDANSVFEANMVVLWGSLSGKLLADITTYLAYLPKNNFLLHINGCEYRVNNQTSTSTLSTFQPNIVLSKCQLEITDFRPLILEARRCLTV